MRSTKARLILRVTGIVLLIPAVALLIRDLAMHADIGLFLPVTLAGYWQSWSPQSFLHLQDLVREHISWRLWDAVLAPALQLPLYLLIGAVALALILASQPWPAKRRRRRGHGGGRGTPSRAAPPA